VKARKVKGLDPDGTLADNAVRIVTVRLRELRSFVPRALDPAEMETLHDMRIAAKRLRYVLEITEPALGRPAADDARIARRIQDLLGEIHDCDVMAPRVRAHMDRLRAQDADRVRRAVGTGAEDLEPAVARRAPNRLRYRGLEALGAYLAARRAVLFDRFVREWAELEEHGFATELLATFRTPVPAPAAPSDGAAP
jgi:hypothetical protein